SATALVAFFPSGVRENNTTVMSAMAHGCAVISNLDASSPKWMEHGKTIFDIGRLDEFPSPAQVAEVGRNARAVVAEFNFENLAKSILAK
ncbi:MAG: glycosyltransferase, partial [Actinomycetota bacterium]